MERGNEYAMKNVMGFKKEDDKIQAGSGLVGLTKTGEWIEDQGRQQEYCPPGPSLQQEGEAPHWPLLRPVPGR